MDRNAICKLSFRPAGNAVLPLCTDVDTNAVPPAIPALAGQQADYFARTLLDYKNGQRHNDIYSRMRLIAQQLSDEEIKELAQYYQQLK
jgi:cytochrome c553